MNSIKHLATALLFGTLLASCADDITVGQVDEQKYQTQTEALATLTDKYGATVADSVIFATSGETDFYVHLTQAATTAGQYTLVYDATVLAAYNQQHGTAYEALPQDLVSITGQGTVEAGQTQSSAISVGYRTADQLATDGTYAIPLRVSGPAAASVEKGTFVFLVRDITKLPDCKKESGFQVISCMEVNDANPLHNLCYTLKESGKLVFDQVILFAGNINYSAETGEVYNYNNENVQHLLDYKEKYLEPLQRKGMKVILGILGNHDRSGVANLSTEGAKKFAQELRAVCDAYGLDGVFFDDEYSSYGDYPGFVSPSVEAASRLCYECKQAMPTKLVEVYVYGRTYSAVSIDGHQPGEFIDYAIQDYGRYSDLSDSYPGLPRSGMIQASSEFARGSVISESRARQIREDGYGGTMVFSLNPQNGYVSRFNNITLGLFGEETVQTGSYSKDW